MDSACDETGKISREFDGDACDFCERYKNNGLSRSSKLLLKFIIDGNVQDKAVLDLGCGAGGLSMELLKRGAQSAVGFDLSPRMIVAATELAQASGFETRAKFQEGKRGNGRASKIGHCGHGQGAVLLFGMEASAEERDGGQQCHCWFHRSPRRRRHQIAFSNCLENCELLPEKERRGLVLFAPARHC
jgi:SAM-dependent methyltransferase